MYLSSDRTILSPSDLVTHLGCGHATERARRVLRGELRAPVTHDPDLEVLRRHGDGHERSELDRFVAAGRSVAEVATTGSSPEALAAAEAETLAHLRTGVDVVYQATFFDGRWRGHADFLLRVDRPSDLGAWSYEPADAKLARRVTPAALVQLCAYAEQLARLQGRWPDELVVITGDGHHHRHRSTDVASYHRRAKADLEATVDGPLAAVEAVPVAHCQVCPWAPDCQEGWRLADHVSLIAGVRTDALAKLGRAGITTGAALAASAAGTPVEGMHPAVVDRLRRQARLQLGQRADGVVRHELLVPAADDAFDPEPPVPEPATGPTTEHKGRGRSPVAPPRGLAALPSPSPGDLFFDIEGDPWVGDHGIEYLFGVVGAGVEGSPGRVAPMEYTAFWGHDRAGEKAAFEGLVDLVVDRLDADPDMHVYHYASYERSVLQRLAARYDTRQAAVDRILRGQVLVDLYQVVRHAVLVSQEGYGLKKLEPLYLPPRSGEAITDGGSSIVVYESWLDSGDPQLLEDLRAYNEVDCRSTLGLRDWLEERRVELAARTGAPVPRPERADGSATPAVAEADEEHASLTAALVTGLPADPGARSAGEHARQLLADLLGWHAREERPQWWAWYERLAMTEEELVADREAVGRLVPLGVVDPDRRVHRYGFDPDQDHKLVVGRPVADPATAARAGTLAALDEAGGTLDLIRPRGDVPHPLAVVPDRPIPTAVLRRALESLARHVVAHGLHGPGLWQAARALLLRQPPSGRGGGSLRTEGEEGGAALVRLAGCLDGSWLAVQGPPGSGKTTKGADAVVALVAAGRRVGITAPSHAAVTNLLDAVCERASAPTSPLAGRGVRAIQKGDTDHASASDAVVQATSNAQVVAALDAGEVDVVAGTAWLFAREELRGALDVVVVDEAGQLSLANTLAVSGAGRDLVLLGDPQQLAQPSKGTHPDGAGVSALDHVLEGAPTLRPGRGLFLDRSYRMHPSICRFVSNISYEDRLGPAPGCERRAVVARSSPVGGATLRWVPVEHAGNRTRCPEEAEVVAALAAELLGGVVTDDRGATRPLRPDDIVVVAPYNAQVAALHDVLPPGVRAGTVDRFQGRQAPVVLYSLTASSAADVPRGLDFLLSTHRLNVAVSRAQALAVVVGSPALLRAPVHSARELRQVNALCRFVDQAADLAAPSASSRSSLTAWPSPSGSR